MGVVTSACASLAAFLFTIRILQNSVAVYCVLQGTFPPLPPPPPPSAAVGVEGTSPARHHTPTLNTP